MNIDEFEVEVEKQKHIIEHLRKQVESLLHTSLQRLERLQEHEISDPIWEQEHGKDEYTGEMIE